MIKKIFIICILIYFFVFPNVYATNEIISSQIEALNLSSVIKEGEEYTEDVFPEIDLTSLLNSALKGEIDNKGIFKNILLMFGDEIVNAISLLGSILIIIVIHSLLKSFTDSLNNGKGIGQVTYYVEYILIVTLIMSNFSNIINMIKDSISNLIGFANSLIPILLGLMSATRKCCVSFFDTTINNICNSIYRKYHKPIYFTSYSNCNNIRNSIKFI